MSSYTEPTLLERELATAVVTVTEAVPPIADAEDLARVIAETLAAHRCRCMATVDRLLEELTERGMTEHSLNQFAQGWTPQQVHRLVDAYRSQRRGIHETANLAREMLARTRTTPPSRITG